MGAHDFLSTVQRDFHYQWASQIHQYTSPYKCIAFDTALSKYRKDYLDPRSSKNKNRQLDQLNRNLADVNDIMHRNINSVMERGKNLEHVADQSSNLRDKSRGFHQQTKWMNFMRKAKMYALGCGVCT